MAAVLTSILYGPYQKLKKFFRGKGAPAALIMCILSLILIILPLSELAIYAARQSVDAYSDTLNFINQNSSVIHSNFLNKLGIFGFDTSSIRAFAADIAERSSSFIVSAATVIFKETTAFVLSLLITVFSMFFFFLDGEELLKTVSRWSPLPDEYDHRLFAKFRAVSYSAIVTTFIVILVHGLIGAIGFVIVGLPYFIPGILITVCSLVPVVGSALIYLPVGIYLLLTGSIWQGVFILLWGAVAAFVIDNFLRMSLLHGKAQINPIFVFFAIIGGTTLFGFWGVIIGPLVVSLAVTVMDLYELEFRKDLTANEMTNAEERILDKQIERELEN
jgi:predicted PurR-regulated permease PerM